MALVNILSSVLSSLLVIFRRTYSVILSMCMDSYKLNTWFCCTELGFSKDIETKEVIWLDYLNVSISTIHLHYCQCVELIGINTLEF